MTIRRLIFWPHLVAGLVAGIVIVIMSVTGVLLTYERQLIAWSDSHLRSVPPAAGAARMPIEALLDRFAREHPDVTPASVTFGTAPAAPVVLVVPQGTLHLDAYSGRVLGEGAQGVRRVMSSLRSWHRWLAVEGEGRTAARAITGWSNVLFLFLVVSGVYLWLPRVWRWAAVRSVLLFRGRLTGKARDFNWHNVIGVWSAIPLFVVVISAVPISFPWGNELVYRAVGEEPPAGGRGGRGGGGREGAPAAGRRGGERGGAVRAAAPAPGDRTGSPRAAAPASGDRTGAPRAAVAGSGDRGGTPRSAATASAGDREARAAAPTTAGLNGLWARAAQHVPGWRSITLRLPDSDSAPVVFAIDRGDGGQPHLRSTLTLDRTSGAVMSDETFSSLTLGRRIRNTMRFAHTGEVLGVPGQTVAGLATFGSLVLAWTGTALTWRRFRAWRRRRGSAELDSRDATAA